MEALTERIEVAVSDRPYSVYIGENILNRMGNFLSIPTAAQRAVIVTSNPVAHRFYQEVRNSLAEKGLDVHLKLVPDGEKAKTQDVVTSCYLTFADVTLSRDDLIVALGGGAVSDVAGFAASTWNRGVATINIPTTLLAQVDSCLGGKTAINLAVGKNLVGTFHQPIGVVVDTMTLPTLSARERSSGLAEVVKYGFILEPSILDLIERNTRAVLSGESILTKELVKRSIECKARIVASDPRENELRAILNYGHTYGQALEAMGAFKTLRHGEAVSLGMVFAARLGERLGISQPGLATRTINILASLNLPVGGLDIDHQVALQLLRRDKKARKGGIRFILCVKPGEVRIVSDIQLDLIIATISEMN